MQNRDSLFDWAIPCGGWFGVRVRLSPTVPLVVAVLCLQLDDVRVALLFGGCLLAAVLLHEAAHLVALRLTGGSVDELLLWPLGGVVKTARSASPAPLAAAAAGPMASLAACCLCLGLLTRTGTGWEVLHPLVLPVRELGDRFGDDLLALAFFANWVLFLANLLPAAPFDGGRALEAVFAPRLGLGLGQQMLARVGIAAGLLVVVAALPLGSVWLCAIGAAVLAYNLRESHRHQLADSFDESFMGYDFSQGYTSLERSVPVETEVRRGLLQRWLMRRRVLREQRQRVRAEEAEKELDILLAKVHTYGIDSLSDTERRTLKRASARYKGRSKS